jgi:hypothetical protein
MTSTPSQNERRQVESDIIEGQPYQCRTRPDHEHKDLLLVYDYWKSKCDEHGRLPTLSEIELMDLWQIAHNMIIVDLVEGIKRPNRFRFRYFGTNVRLRSRVEMTDRFIDDIFPEEALPEAHKIYSTVLSTGIPNIWKRKIDFIEKPDEHSLEKQHEYSYTRLLVPLLNKNQIPAHLLGVFHMR